MCGLYGMAGNLAYRDKDVLKVLAILSTVRGEDSAGLVTVTNGGAIDTMKAVGSSFDLFALSAWDKLALGNKQAVIGHTRKATVGLVSKATAHPFHETGAAGTFVGVHNGTLERWRDLPVGPGVSDSATLYANMAEHGLADTLARVGGAYALVYYDAGADTINFIRNNQRTLYYAMSEDFTKFIWASEPWMIWAAVSRADWNLANMAAKDATACYVEPFDPDTLVRLSVRLGKDPLSFADNETVLGNTIKPEVKTYGRPFHGYQSPYRTPFAWDEDENNEEPQRQLSPPDTTRTASASSNSAASTTASTNSTATASSASRAPRPTLSLVSANNESGSKQSDESNSSSQKRDVILVEADDLDDPLPSTFRVVLDSNRVPIESKEAFEKLTDSKCCFCGTDVDYDDALEHAGGAVHIPGIRLWVDRNRFVCTTCTPPLNS